MEWKGGGGMWCFHLSEMTNYNLPIVSVTTLPLYVEIKTSFHVNNNNNNNNNRAFIRRTVSGYLHVFKGADSFNDT